MMMSGVLHHLGAVPGPLALAVIAALVFAEAAVFVGFVLPGETAVLLGGVLAATGRISLPQLLLVVVAAAVLGDTVGYELGRLVGPRLLSSRLLRRHSRRLESAQLVLRERGGFAVTAGRFTAFLRAVMPALAGISRMPYRRFVLYNALGGVLWGVGVALLGFFAGTSAIRIVDALGRWSLVGLAALLIVGVLWWRLRRNRRIRAERTDESHDPVGSKM